jgi:serine/threonine-protein kinase RsbW
MKRLNRVRMVCALQTLKTDVYVVIKNKRGGLMSSKQFQKTFPTNIADAKQVVSEMLIFLKSEVSPIADDDLFDLKLIFSELVYNAVLHGNCEDANKNVNVKIKIHNYELYCEVSDEGKGFDYNSLISTFSNDTAETLFSEHGRGIRLVLSLVDKLDFNDQGNSINFLKRLNVNG